MSMTARTKIIMTYMVYIFSYHIRKISILLETLINTRKIKGSECGSKSRQIKNISIRHIVGLIFSPKSILMMKSNFAHRMSIISFQILPWGNFFDVYLFITVYIDTKKYYFTLINHSKIKVFASVTYCFLFRYSITVYITTQKCS